ncbi:unnamed protein product [Adineta steineri]|uniref:Transmembrane protein n=1 Tax=Adineta steineri TaxID=433720 RepID=A0A814HIX3_9BILA|nr:unnamed protein product [Adineta steineri]CAF1087885.1 unnamed protein product [Adineta steineri]
MIQQTISVSCEFIQTEYKAKFISKSNDYTSIENQRLTHWFYQKFIQMNIAFPWSLIGQQLDEFNNLSFFVQFTKLIILLPHVAGACSACNELKYKQIYNSFLYGSKWFNSSFLSIMNNNSLNIDQLLKKCEQNLPLWSINDFIHLALLENQNSNNEMYENQKSTSRRKTIILIFIAMIAGLSAITAIILISIEFNQIHHLAYEAAAFAFTTMNSKNLTVSSTTQLTITHFNSNDILPTLNSTIVTTTVTSSTTILTPISIADRNVSVIRN